MFVFVDIVVWLVEYDLIYICLVNIVDYLVLLGNVLMWDIDGDGVIDLWDDCFDIIVGVDID